VSFGETPVLSALSRWPLNHALEQVQAIVALLEEHKLRYGAVRVALDGPTLELAHTSGSTHLVGE
jgi:hypothetical protein